MNSDSEYYYDMWVSENILRATDNFIRRNPYSEDQLDILVKWLMSKKPDLKKQDFDEAIEMSKQWMLVESYETHEVIYKDGEFDVVQLKTDQDLNSEIELMKLNGMLSEKAIFSVRSPNNVPQASIVMNYYRDENNVLNYQVDEVFGRPENAKDFCQEPSPNIKSIVKNFFNHLKSTGTPITQDDNHYIEVDNAYYLKDFDLVDEYGIDNNFSTNIGDYIDNLNEIESGCESQGHYYLSKAHQAFDKLLEYASRKKELPQLEQAIEQYEQKVWERFHEYEDSITYENPCPDEADFMIEPDAQLNQPEFEGKEFEGKAFLNQEAYDEAMKKYEDERAENERNFEPAQLADYMQVKTYKALEPIRALEQQNAKGTKSMSTQIYKIAANIKEEEVPDAETLATYIEAINLCRKDNTLSNESIKIIDSLPTPRQIRMDFSNQECVILFETIKYIWRKLTGKDIVEENKIQKAKGTLMGNYWMLKNGVLLNGINHYTMIKNNANLFSSLLHINGLVLQQKLAIHPFNAIELVLRHGGIRMFINNDRKMYVQMSEDTYAKWGKSKIQKYDFKDRIVRIVSFKKLFNGWKSGLAVKL